MKRRSQWMVLFLLLGLICCTRISTVYAQASAHFSPKLAHIIHNSPAHEAFWSVIVRDSTGHVLQSYHSNKLVRPASNLKLFTSAAVLDELGANFKYKTYMYGIGHQQGHVWDGDIVFRGSGDPSISGRFYDDDRLYVLDSYFAKLDSMGITRINGNLIGNDSYFDEKPYPKGWSWDDLTYYYGVQINALSFNDNAVDLTVRADGKVGSKPHIEWFPFDTDYVNFVNEQIITPFNSDYQESYHRLLGTNTIMLKSSLPKHYLEKESLSVMDPPMYFLDTFKKYLEQGGIKLKGHIILDNQSQDWNSGLYHVLAVHVSHPLKDLLKEMNKNSDNFYAEMLLKTAAAEHYQTQGTTELGIQLVKDFADSMGVDTTDIKMTDGSGMSPVTLVTTRGISKLLVNMQFQPYFKVYKNSLAISGEDGTLQYRFQGTLDDRIHGKTGYISGVRALSGYMRSKKNHKLIFSIITNNYTIPTAEVDTVQAALARKIYATY